MQPGIQPSSTYRLQLHREFAFDDAAKLAGYLARLGVSHAYFSPYLKAEPGSLHGYDVVDPTRVNDELGGAPGLERLRLALEKAGLRQVLDIVPNHMAADAVENRWWADVLANGRDSQFAHYFDIDWEAAAGKVVLPVLGRDLQECIEAGELHIDGSGAEPVLMYYEHTFPLARGAASGSDLHAILADQHYELTYWRTGLDRINYRRFFDIAQLVGVRVEDADVFDATHALILPWLETGALAGVRVDHPDGLRDPAGYLERLRSASADAWIVAEKILEPGEELPDWPIAGTTGYDFINQLTNVLVDPAAEPALTSLYVDFSGERDGYHRVVQESKSLVMTVSFEADLQRLTRLLRAAEIPAAPDGSEAALRELIASFPVYRTYATSTISDRDDAHVREAVETARLHLDQRHWAALDRIAELLLLRSGDAAAREFVARFQQTTGPVMAKGVEDTAFYRYNRFVALNEVGGNPGQFGSSLTSFHREMSARAAKWPAAMSATSTHDTKRSEDVRARLAVLSEVPQEWQAAVLGWSAMNAKHKTAGMPDANAEYLLYQVLVGAHPLSTERAHAYALKAAREAKAHTGWLDPSAAYEDALREFIDGCLHDDEFCCALGRFVESIRDAGFVNSLTQKLIALTAPGMPDIYQGTELWDWSLVDPDNRRPVDYELRRRLLDRLGDLEAETAWAERQSGLPKLLVVARALELRRRLPAVFARGAYEPLSVAGDRSEHVIAFAREGRAATIAPRLSMRVAGDWGETVVDLPGGEWRNQLTGEPVQGTRPQVGDLLRRFPVALLAAA